MTIGEPPEEDKTLFSRTKMYPLKFERKIPIFYFPSKL